MKEIKKERTKVETYFEYEAIDGTLFSTKDECLKYDESARAVLQSKYNKLIVNRPYEYDIIGLGSEDNVVNVLKLNGKSDADIVKQMLFFENPHYKEHLEDEEYPWLKEYLNTIDEISCSDDVLFVGRGYEEDSFWIIGTCKSLCKKINSFNKTDKTKSEPEYGGC